MTADTLDTPVDVKTPTKISDLNSKDKLTGTITRIELFGALVDIGGGLEGLLHVSQFSKNKDGEKSSNRVQDKVQIGDTVTVWVRKVDAAKGRIDLTMIEPLGLEWREIKKGITVNGTVVRLENFGAFIDIGAERPALLHVREMSTNYVSHPSELLKIGEEVQARVLNVDRRRRKIDLSTKVIDEEAQAVMMQDIKDDEEMLSPMALALQAAMDAKGQTGGKKRRQKRKKSYSREQDDLFSRTLQSQDKDQG